MMRKVASPKGAKAKADRLFSLIIRSRGACEACGRTENLQCAHIVSRRFSHTRCDEDNAFCLCARCHMHFTDHPVEFAEFVLDQIGAKYALIYRRSQQTGKVNWNETAARLSERWKEIEEAA